MKMQTAKGGIKITNIRENKESYCFRCFVYTGETSSEYCCRCKNDYWSGLEGFFNDKGISKDDLFFLIQDYLESRSEEDDTIESEDSVLHPNNCGKLSWELYNHPF